MEKINAAQYLDKLVIVDDDVVGKLIKIGGDKALVEVRCHCGKHVCRLESPWHEVAPYSAREIFRRKHEATRVRVPM